MLEEKIEYNDLVNSIKDGNIPGDDKPNDKEATGNEDAGSKNGNFHAVLISNPLLTSCC